MARRRRRPLPQRQRAQRRPSRAPRARCARCRSRRCCWPAPLRLGRCSSRGESFEEGDSPAGAATMQRRATLTVAVPQTQSRYQMNHRPQVHAAQCDRWLVHHPQRAQHVQHSAAQRTCRLQRSGDGSIGGRLDCWRVQLQWRDAAPVLGAAVVALHPILQRSRLRSTQRITHWMTSRSHFDRSVAIPG